MENFQVKINTLNSLLPQNVPFVIGQVSEAVKLCTATPADYDEKCGETDDWVDKANRNLDIAIQIAEQVNKYSQGAMLYNYKPILIALLKDLPEDTDLSVFDTINHDVLIGLATVKQFLKTYALKAKRGANFIVDNQDNESACMVIFANMLKDIQRNLNALPIAFIMTNLNLAHTNFTNGCWHFYSEVIKEVGNADF
jgi:hypothetical protein